MQFLNVVLPSAAENLALDEALLEASEESKLGEPGETLRVWESPELAVVVGRSSRVDVEVDRPFCRDRGIPILRRCSGGAAVLIGPGCLMYSVILDSELRPQLKVLEQAHQFVLERVASAINATASGAVRAGTSDLTIANRKFSGNSLRCKRRFLLYHGTLLCDFDLSLIEQCLRTPPRQPDYREQRTHSEFLTCLGCSSRQLGSALRAVWECDQVTDDWPQKRTAELMQRRYSTIQWNEGR